DMVHVPYKGVAPALTAVVGGEVDLTTASANVAGAMLNAGRIHALAIAGPKRSSLFPDVATTVEQGYPDLQAAVLYVLVAPPQTPDDVVSRISADVIEILGRPDFVQKQATSRGLDVVAGGPDELRQALHEDTELSRRMVQAAGVQPE
nr:tripartite tricarboxylate transporter substrate binding protein [Pseudomonas sp.]